MGDANTSRTSKAKSVLGGLVGSLKRVAGRGKEEKEAAPRTGVSLRDRFSALEPSAAPTEGVPKKMPEDIPEPERNDVEVIHTSAVRSSGSVRFSDRIGLAVASEAEEGYDRRITFDDIGANDEEDLEITESMDITETEVSEDIDVVTDVEEISEETVEEAVEIIEEAAEEIVEEMIEAEAEVTTVPDAEPEITIAEEIVEVILTAEETKVEMPVEEKVEIKTPVKEEKAEIRAPRAEEKNERSETLRDDFDGGYDFLPKRGVSDRFAGIEKRTVRKEAGTAPVAQAPSPPAEKKEDTILAQRMRAKNAEPAPKKVSEIQLDGPVQHAGTFRTSLLNKVTREKSSGKSISEIITESKCVEEETPRAFVEDVEECDADVSSAAVEPIRARATEIVEDMPQKNEVAAESESVGAEDVFVEEIIEITEDEEMLPETADIEDAEGSEEEFSVAIEVIAEAEEVQETVEVAVEIVETVEEASEVIEETVEEAAEVIEAVAEETVEELAGTSEIYLKEIENDVPLDDVHDAHTDDAEVLMDELLTGIVSDDGIIPADVPATVAETSVEASVEAQVGLPVEAPAEAPTELPAAVADAEDEEDMGGSFALCFSFLSEVTETPSASVAFVWG